MADEYRPDPYDVLTEAFDGDALRAQKAFATLAQHGYTVGDNSFEAFEEVAVVVDRVLPDAMTFTTVDGHTELHFDSLIFMRGLSRAGFFVFRRPRVRQELYSFAEGAMFVHPADRCSGNYCCVHNPSAHHMAGWPLVSEDTRYGIQLRRECEHHELHPDPDSLAYIGQVRGPDAVAHDKAHPCDGCCTLSPEGTPA